MALQNWHRYFPSKYGLAWLGIFSALFFNLSCLKDSGFASPSDERNLQPLATYVGKTVFGTDTAAPHRIIDLVNAKVGILWRAVGNRDKQSSSNLGSVKSEIPFNFSFSLLQAPPKEVIEAPEISFGIFCLFSDANQNGNFDRLMHPDILSAYSDADKYTAQANADLKNLLSVSESKKKSLAVEKFYLEASGALTIDRAGILDTLMPAGTFSDIDGATGYLRTYQRILGDQNRWVRFFAVRKKDNEFYYRTFAANGHYSGIELRFDQAVYPVSGQEKNFYSLLKKAIASSIKSELVANQIIYKAFFSGKMDYPFSGYGQAGEDWMAGRSITDLVLYLPTSKTLDSLLEAIPTGSFQFSHLDRLQQGYNLVRCNDQYVCDVLDPSDSITIYLGTTEGFFNPPGSPSKSPIASGKKEKNIPSIYYFKFMQGHYALNGGDTLSLIIHNNQVWCDANEIGLVRLLPSDSLTLYSPERDFQILFTHSSSKNIPDRIVQYTQNKRLVVLRLDSAVSNDILNKIDGINNQKSVSIGPDLLKAYAGNYDFGSDTLKIIPKGTDSLAVSIPGFSAIKFYSSQDSLFQSSWGPWTLKFEGFGGESFSRVIFFDGVSKKVVPNFKAVSSNLLKSTKDEEKGIDWILENQGSGRDTFMELDGGKRYSCSDDGRFLQAGDGVFLGFGYGPISDSISMVQGGNSAAFRLPGLKGKVVYFQLRNCLERVSKGDGKNTRIRISAWGGSKPDSLQLLYGDQQWMEANPAGLQWGMDSLMIDADPYYLTVKEENTQDAPVWNAFDGYKLGVRP